VDGGLGYSYVDLAQFSSDNFLPGVDRYQRSGLAAHLGLGFRVLNMLTLGARGSLASYEGFEVGTVVAEVGLRPPFPGIEPYGRLGVGYGWVGNADYMSPRDSDTSVYGLVAEAGAGVDLYLSDLLSIGAGFDAAFLNLSRQRADQGCDMGACMIDEVNFEQDGDAVGLQMRLHGHATLHF
jgi:hypothetical protein